MRLELPWPPSANRRLVPARVRWVTAPDYRAWHEAAAAALVTQHVGGPGWQRHAPGPPVAVFINACPPDNRVRDLDNLIKPAIDALVRAKIVERDDTRYITYVACYLGPVIPGGLLRVTIESNA